MRRTRVLLLLALLVVLPVSIPTAQAAYAWEETRLYDDRDNAPARLVNVALAEYGDDLLLYRGGKFATCTSGAETTCAAEVTIADGYTCIGAGVGNAFCGADLHETHPEVLSCVWHGAVIPKAIYTDDGSNHAVRSVMAGASSYVGCGVWNLGAGTWLFTTANETGDTIEFYKSTNYGVTWSFTNVTTGFDPLPGGVSIAAKSATEYGIVATNDANEVTFYRSTDSGGTWGTGVIANSAGGGPVDLQVAGTNWLITYTNSGTSILKSSNGALWTSQVANAAGAGGRGEIRVVNATTWYAVQSVAGTGISPAAQVAVAWTNNTGVSYTSTTECSVTPPDVIGFGSEVWTDTPVGGASVVYDDDTGILTVVAARPFTHEGGAGTVTTACATNVDATGGDVIVEPSHSLALGSIPTGFDVDPAGNTIILRSKQVNGPVKSNVTTYAAGTLQPIGGPFDTECDNRRDGVMSGSGRTPGEHVAFLKCDGDDGSDPSHLYVRTKNLGAPNFTGCSPCAQDIGLDDSGSGDGFAGDGNGLVEITDVAYAPISHEHFRTGGAMPVCTSQQAFVAWAFTGFDPSSGAGRIGVDMFTNRGGQEGAGCPGESDIRNTVYASYGQPDGDADHGGTIAGARQICLSPTSDPTVFTLIAVHDSYPTVRYEVRFRLDSNDFGRKSLNADLVPQGSYNGLSNAVAISCSQQAPSKMLLALDRGATDLIALVDVATGGAHWQRSTALALHRSVALSGNANFFLYQEFRASDATFPVLFGNSTTGNITGSTEDLGFPVYRVAYSMDGSDAFGVVPETTGGTLYRWDTFGAGVGPATLGSFNPAPTQTVAIGESGELFGANGVIGAAGCGFAFGVSGFGGGLICTSLVMMGMSGSLGVGMAELGRRYGGRVSWWAVGWAVAVGAIVGFLIGFAVEWIGVGTALFTAVLILGGFAAWIGLARSRRG